MGCIVGDHSEGMISRHCNVQCRRRLAVCALPSFIIYSGQYTVNMIQRSAPPPPPEFLCTLHVHPSHGTSPGLCSLTCNRFVEQTRPLLIGGGLRNRARNSSSCAMLCVHWQPETALSLLIRFRVSDGIFLGSNELEVTCVIIGRGTASRCLSEGHTLTLARVLLIKYCVLDPRRACNRYHRAHSWGGRGGSLVSMGTPGKGAPGCHLSCKPKSLNDQIIFSVFIE